MKESSEKKLRKIIKEEIQKLTEGIDEKGVLQGYLTTALWTEEEQLEDEIEAHGTDYAIHNIDNAVKKQALKDIKTFLKKAQKEAPEELEDYSPSEIGHNIWLSRNGHGAGFFDDNNDKLQDIAEKLKGKYLYVGDDGAIYID